MKSTSLAEQLVLARGSGNDSAAEMNALRKKLSDLDIEYKDFKQKTDLLQQAEKTKFSKA